MPQPEVTISDERLSELHQQVQRCKPLKGSLLNGIHLIIFPNRFASDLEAYKRQIAEVGMELGQGMGLNRYGSGIFTYCFSRRIIYDYVPQLQVKLITTYPVLAVGVTETIISAINKVFPQRNSLAPSNQEILEMKEDAADSQNDNDLTEEAREKEKRRIEEEINSLFTHIIGVGSAHTTRYYELLSQAGDALGNTLFRTPLNNVQVRSLMNYYSRSLGFLMVKTPNTEEVG